MNAWISGIGIAVALSGGIWAIGKFIPGILVKKVHGLFAAAKVSPWWRDAAHPKRARLLLAVAEFLEDEIPEPGQGKALYEALGAKIAALMPLLIGTGPKWASALEKAGDAIDTELDSEIKDISALIATPVTPAA